MEDDFEELRRPGDPFTGDDDHSGAYARQLLPRCPECGGVITTVDAEYLGEE